MEMLTAEQFEQLRHEEQIKTFVNTVNEAENDNTPYVGIVDDEIHIIGDPNKTENKKHDYEIAFAFPNTPEWKKVISDNGEQIEKETDNFIKVVRKYKGVYLTPRYASNVVEAFTRVISFIRDISVTKDELDDNGNPVIEIKNMTEEESIEMLSELNNEVEESIYNAVGTFFRLSDTERDCMLINSAIYNAVQIVVYNPEIVNESDLFFG